MKNHNHCGHKILIVADCKFYVSEVHYQKKNYQKFAIILSLINEIEVYFHDAFWF